VVADGINHLYAQSVSVVGPIQSDGRHTLRYIVKSCFICIRHKREPSERAGDAGGCT